MLSEGVDADADAGVGAGPVAARRPESALPVNFLTTRAKSSGAPTLPGNTT